MAGCVRRWQAERAGGIDGTPVAIVECTYEENPEIDDLPDTDGAARTSNSGRELSEGHGRGPCARAGKSFGPWSW